MEKIEVVSPLGFEAVRQAGVAGRIESLNGKTIGEFWNGVFKGDLAFPVIREALKKKYPGLRVVPYGDFPHAPHNDDAASQRELARRMAAVAKEKGCDAVISGMGA
jgi:hypothetical protein